MEFIKMVGSFAGFLALLLNIYIHVNSKSGKLEVTLGWGSNQNHSTYLYIDVNNKGIGARTIKNVYLVYLDDMATKSWRNSTQGYIKVLPKLTLLRGEIGIEVIQYQSNPHLKNLFLTRKILFRVVDYFDKTYDSTRLNDGTFALPGSGNKM